MRSKLKYGLNWLRFVCVLAGFVTVTDTTETGMDPNGNAFQLTKVQKRIAEIGQIFGSRLNLEEIFDEFAGQVRKLIPAEPIIL